jgi:hypothetical protein
MPPRRRATAPVHKPDENTALPIQTRFKQK